MRRVDAYEAARILRVTPALIRKWAHRGHIGRHGMSEAGRTLYDPSELLVYLDTRGGA